MAELGLAVALLLIFSALASGTEAALFAVPHSKVLAFSNARRKGADSLRQVKDNMDRSIMAIVIINNIANIVGSIVVGALAQSYFADTSLLFGLIPVVGFFTALLTLTVIAFAEVVPKTIGERRCDQISLFMAPVVLLVSRFLFPLIWALELVTYPFSSLAGKSDAVTSEEEIRALTDLGSKAGIIEKDEKELIHRVFQLNDITAWDIMTPLSRVRSLDGQLTVGSVRKQVALLPHTRLPVHTGNLDQMVGVVHLRDILLALAEDQDDITIQSLAKPPSFIPSSAAGDDLLQHFQKTKQHLAIVVDAFGNVLGILTLEDVLEELVGEIVDETDIESETIQRLGLNEVLVAADVPTIDINQVLGCTLPDGRIGELLLEEYGRIPSTNEKIRRYGIEFTITEATPRMIQKVKLRLLSNDEIVDEDTEVA